MSLRMLSLCRYNQIQHFIATSLPEQFLCFFRSFFFFFNDTATTEIYTLPLHDALPICDHAEELRQLSLAIYAKASAHARERGLILADTKFEFGLTAKGIVLADEVLTPDRSEEHTSELQSRQYLVCRLLLEKKKRTLHAEHAPIDKAGCGIDKNIIIEPDHR